MSRLAKKPQGIYGKLTHEQQEELFLFLQDHTYEQGREWCRQNAEGFTPAVNTLADFFKGFPVYNAARSVGTVGAALGQILKEKKIDIEAGKLAELAEEFLLTVIVREDDVRGFIMMERLKFDRQKHVEVMAMEQAKLDEARKNRELSERKFEIALMSKIEAGIAELERELSGNPEAAAAFARLREMLGLERRAAA